MRQTLRISYHLFFVFLLIFSVSHCGLFGEGAKVKYPNKVTSEMDAEYNRAERDFKNKDYPQAAMGFQNYLNRFPYNRLSDQASFRLGQIKMLSRDYGDAARIFSDLVRKTPDPAVASRARVKAGISQYRLKNYQAALSDFYGVQGQYIRSHDKIKASGLALIILNKEGAPLERKAYFYALLMDGYQGLSPAVIQKRYGSEAPSLQVVQEQMNTWVKAPATLEQIDGRFPSYQPKAQASAPYIDYKLGKAYYQAGNQKMAKKYLGQLVSRFGNTQLARDAKPLLAQMGYKGEKVAGGQIKVGVILPLSGKYETFGRATLNGMECAVGAKPGCSGPHNILLVTRDDGGSPAASVRAVEELVNVEKVNVIVGPLSSASALSAAKKAQELGVVMISLAQKEGIPSVGNEIFRFSLTPDQQVKALLTYSTKKKGKKLVGVFYPKNNYGRVFMQKFKEMAPSYGAEVTAAQSYTSSKDVSGDLRNLKFSVAKTSPDAPIGFNAIFIPDSYINVLHIAPQLKVSGLDNMLLLGTNAWNDSNLARKSGGELGDVLFLDIYFKDSQNPRVKTFVREYQAAFGQTPTTLEAMGYDVIRLISEVGAKVGDKNREQFRQTLIEISGFEGVTGLRSFAANREARLRPYMLTVRDQHIEELE